MSRTHTQTVYKFSELDGKVQSMLIEKQQQAASEFFDGTETVYEDAATIAALFGLDIDIRYYKTVGGEPCIYYSGFCSQGDGACFEGSYSYRKGAVRAVKEYAPTDGELHAIVERLQRAQARYLFGLTAKCKHSGHYYHSGCMQVDVETGNDIINQSKWNDAESEVTAALRQFADWIYNQLEQVYDWETSENQAREYLENADDEYTADGKII